MNTLALHTLIAPSLCPPVVGEISYLSLLFLHVPCNSITGSTASVEAEQTVFITLAGATCGLATVHMQDEVLSFPGLFVHGRAGFTAK